MWRQVLGQKLRCYEQLSKSRLSSLVVVTSGAGFLMAGAGSFDWLSLTSVSAGTMLAACSANTFNQLYEQQPDKLMHRTHLRPLPSGRISRSEAAVFGVSTAALSTAVLTVGANPLTAALGLFNIGLYAGVYTPLKQHSELNTWVGAVVGAIPPLMGYAAATNTLMAPESLLAASTLFLWQFPHFFALSWRLRKDYARGGFQMVPCNDPTGQRTATLVLKYALYLAPLPILASVTGVTTHMFALEGTLINAYAIHLAGKFYQTPNDAHAKKVFHCSLWYLPALLAFMVYHSKNWMQDESDNQHQDLLLDNIAYLRDGLKGVCMHEMLWGKNNTSDNSQDDEDDNNKQKAHFCPVVVTDNVVDSAVANASSVVISRSPTKKYV